MSEEKIFRYAPKAAADVLTERNEYGKDEDNR
jgi:hypothetical protein